MSSRVKQTGPSRGGEDVDRRDRGTVEGRSQGGGRPGHAASPQISTGGHFTCCFFVILFFFLRFFFHFYFKLKPLSYFLCLLFVFAFFIFSFLVFGFFPSSFFQGETAIIAAVLRCVFVLSFLLSRKAQARLWAVSDESRRAAGGREGVLTD